MHSLQANIMNSVIIRDHFIPGPGNIAIVLCFLFFQTVQTHAQRLSPFQAKTLNIPEAHGERLPYERTTSFFDFLNDTDPYNTIVSGQPAVYIYLYLPSDITELGIRIISPVPELFFADRGDIETDQFSALSPVQRNSWFDPGMRLEKISLDSNNNFSDVTLLDSNSESREVPALPNSKFENPLIRLTADTIKAGYYRITLINEKPETHKNGSFVIQIGTVPKVKGIKISRDRFDPGK